MCVSTVLSTSSLITWGRLRFWTVSPGWVWNLTDCRQSLPFLHVSRHHWTKLTERLINLKLKIYHEKFALYYKIFQWDLWLFGRDPFNKNSNRSNREKGSTSKGGPVFRNFSGWTEQIHWVLDRNFRKFWLNGSRPLFVAKEREKKSLPFLAIKRF